MESMGLDLDRAAWALSETKVNATAGTVPCAVFLPMLSSHSFPPWLSPEIHLPASEVWLQLGRSQEP